MVHLVTLKMFNKVKLYRTDQLILSPATPAPPHTLKKGKKRQLQTQQQQKQVYANLSNMRSSWSFLIVLLFL